MLIRGENVPFWNLEGNFHFIRICSIFLQMALKRYKPYIFDARVKTISAD